MKQSNSLYSMHSLFVRSLSLCVSIILMAVLAACGSSGSGDPGSDVAGDPGIVTTSEEPSSGSLPESAGGGSGASNVSVTTRALPEMISSEDSSVLRNAIASGQDLSQTLLSTNYYCYGKNVFDNSKPLITISVDGQSYSSTVVGGPSDTGQWKYYADQGGYIGLHGTEDTGFKLEVLPHGQVLRWGREEDQEVADSCYQEGGAHEYALQQYAMKDPAAGDYQCRSTDTGTLVGILNLQGDGNYSVDGSSGFYITQNVFSTDEDADPTLIAFPNGPFSNMAARYAEYPGSGYQEMLFEESDAFTTISGSGSSSSSQMLCSRQGTPTLFKHYGSAPAEEPASPGTSLSGLYAINASVLTAIENTNTIYYIDFRPNGYMHDGAPFVGGADCSLTNPAGFAYCGTYQYNGTVLSLASFGLETVEFFAESSSGVLITLNEMPIEPVTALNRDSLLGDWKYENTESGGLALCAAGFCSGSIFKANITFRSDGTFFSDTDSFSFNSSNLVNVSTFGQSTSSEAISGTFTLNGNFLTMDFANGYSVTEIVHYGFDNTILAIGERGFRKQ